jgi:hypothetical protein
MMELSQLTDEQAIEAVKLLYEITPIELWQDGRKPNATRVGVVVSSLRDNAPDEAKPLLEKAMSDDANTVALKAELARLVLTRAKAIPELEKYVSESIETTAKKVLALDPLTGAFIIAMLLAVPSIHVRGKDGGSVEIIPGGGLTQVLAALDIKGMLHELPAIVAALPKEISVKLFSSLRGAGNDA